MTHGHLRDASQIRSRPTQTLPVDTSQAEVLVAIVRGDRNGKSIVVQRELRSEGRPFQEIRRTLQPVAELEIALPAQNYLLAY
jgi:hypothetical protein